MEYIVETKNITKIFKGKPLLQEVNLTVNKGENYGLLGPNGAGKTTLMKTIVNLIHLTTGTVEVCNESIDEKKMKYLRKI